MVNVKRYTNNVKDEISPGKKKCYSKLTQRKAKVWMRARLDLLDPTPRRPYRPNNIWNCKFCDCKEQTTEHYVVHCEGTEETFHGTERKEVSKAIQTLEMNNNELTEITEKLEKLYEALQK